MCGIAGLIDPSLSHEQARKTCDVMLESIAHRGPDNRGIWQSGEVTIGHNRLSIIDLHEEANQPMIDKELVLVFNGEIYNYIEIREELQKLGHTFRTSSDTEVILKAFREWGEECVQRFMGMWAFVIWDDQRKTLFASRDRFGIKPFYYIHDGNKFYFGSEIKAVKCAPVFSGGINNEQVSRGLFLGWTGFQNQTYFTKVLALPEAHNLSIEGSSISVKKYWDVNVRRGGSGSEVEQVERFRELFLDSVRLHSRSDVTIGSCLSGGLDSSAITSSFCTQNPEVDFKTFTIYYEGKGSVDERPFVEQVVKKFKNIEPHFFTPSPEQIESEFDRFIYHADVPVAGSSPFSQYFLMKLAASEKVKVLLDGQGADEYLGGYLHSFSRLIGDSILRFRYSEALIHLYHHYREHLSSAAEVLPVVLKSVFMSTHDESEVYNYEIRKWKSLTNSAVPHVFLPERSSSRVDNFYYHQLFSTSLPSLLQYEDRNSMAFSIESRVPFLDHRLVEFAFSIPHSLIIANGTTKYILREALKNYLPEAIYGRKDKKGFVTPGEEKWLRGPLRQLLETDFKSLSDIIRPSEVQKLVKRFKEGDSTNCRLIWRLAITDYWLRKQ